MRYSITDGSTLPQMLAEDNVYYDTQFGGNKGVGLALGIAAAVAVPFIAPTIAAGLGTAGMSAGLANALAYGGTGAALQAGVAATTGGDVGQAALIGAGTGLLSGLAANIGTTAAAGTAGGTAAGTATGTAAGTATGTAAGTAAGTATGTAAGTAAGAAAPVDPWAGLRVAGASTTAPTAGSKFLRIALQQSPQLVSTGLQRMAASQQLASLDELERQMNAAYRTDQAQYQKLQAVYNQLLADANNMSPEFQAQIATKRQQQKEAVAASEAAGEAAMRGGVSKAFTAAEQRRAQSSWQPLVAGRAAGVGAQERQRGLRTEAVTGLRGLQNPELGRISNLASLESARAGIRSQRAEQLGQLYAGLVPIYSGYRDYQNNLA